MITKFWPQNLKGTDHPSPRFDDNIKTNLEGVGCEGVD